MKSDQLSAARNQPRFTYDEAERASDEWGFNCGPAAVAAICGLTIAELRPHLGDFELKRYTNPSMMVGILHKLGVGYSFEFGLNAKFEMQRTGRKPWPRFGLTRIQWEGPWTREGVPMAARYRHTHWIGVNSTNPDNVGIWDVNCLNNGTGWTSLENWTRIAVPAILANHPRANGKWHLTHTVEVGR